MTAVFSVFKTIPGLLRSPIINLPGNRLALEGEVDRMLDKGAMELVNQPGPGFYSQLFLV